MFPTSKSTSEVYFVITKTANKKTLFCDCRKCTIFKIFRLQTIANQLRVFSATT